MLVISVSKLVIFMVDNVLLNSSMLKMVINKMLIFFYKVYVIFRVIFFIVKERNIYDSVIIISIKIKFVLLLFMLVYFIESVLVILVVIVRVNKI